MKIFFVILFGLIILPCFAEAEKTAIFEVKALYELQDGIIKNTSGTYTQAFSLENGSLCRIYAQNNNHTSLNDTEKTCFATKYIPTLEHNKDYYIALESGDRANAIFTLDKDFKTITIYQFNGLSNHCTIWYGKIKK